MPAPELVDFDLHVSQELCRDLDTNEETVRWVIGGEALDSPVSADTLPGALDILATCIGDDESNPASIAVEDLTDTDR